MKKLLRFMALTAAFFAVLFLGTGVVVAATVVNSGIVFLEVHEKSADGVSFKAPVPAALLQYGAGLTRLIDDPELEQARLELEPLLPVVESFTDELLATPSFTLVEVRTPDEEVLIKKEGRQLHLYVDSPDARVRLSMPIGLVERVLDSIAG